MASSTTYAIWTVFFLSLVMAGDALRLQERSILNTIGEKLGDYLPGNMLGAMKKLLENEHLTEDCKTSIRECISQKAIGNCREDVKACAQEAFLGENADPEYSNMGPDVDLPKLMQDIATEIGMSDGIGIAKKILKLCLTYQSASFLTAVTELFKKKDKQLSFQAEFLCRALTGKDMGQYQDSLSAPPQCKNFDNEHKLCKANTGTKSLTLVFKEYYPKVVASAHQQSQAGIDFRECWQKEDRTLCVAALMLGRVCQPACDVALCTYRQLSHDVECSEKLKLQAGTFFKGAHTQCTRLAEAMRVTGIEECKNPEQKSASIASVQLGIGVAIFWTAMLVS